MTWYVVHCGRKTGIFSTWKECHQQVNGFSGACYEGYKTEAQAIVAFKGNTQEISLPKAPNQSMGSSLKDVILIVQFIFCLLYTSPSPRD